MSKIFINIELAGFVRVKRSTAIALSNNVHIIFEVFWIAREPVHQERVRIRGCIRPEQQNPL